MKKIDFSTKIWIRKKSDDFPIHFVDEKIVNARLKFKALPPRARDQQQQQHQQQQREQQQLTVTRRPHPKMRKSRRSECVKMFIMSWAVATRARWPEK